VSPEETAPSPLVTPEEPLSAEAPAIPEADLLPLKHPGTGPALSEEEVDPYQRDSHDAEQAFKEAVRAAEAGNVAEAVQCYLRAAKIAETAHEWFLAAVSFQRVAEYLRSPGGVVNPDRALRLYRRAVAAYEHCGLFVEARELTYRVQHLKMRYARQLGLSWFWQAEMYFYWLTSGFGVRPLRVFVSAVVLVLVYGLLYWAIDGVIHSQGHPVAGFGDALYFSGVTFSTIGYGDFLPASHARLLALTEGGLDLITMSYFVVVLANRLSKS
jgi:hypothetical protein